MTETQLDAEERAATAMVALARDVTDAVLEPVAAAEATVRVARCLAHLEAECECIRDGLRALGRQDAETTLADRCYNMVQNALLFGAVELAAELGVSDDELPD